MDQKEIQSLIQTIESMQNAMLQVEETGAVLLEEIHPSYRDSAINLLHYLALKDLS